MATPLTKDDLVDLFRRLGAPSPEDWAHSQVTEGIPQLARFIFLKQAWCNVVPEGNTAWIEDAVRSAQVGNRTTHMPGWAQLARCQRPTARHPTISWRFHAGCYKRVYFCDCVSARRTVGGRILTRNCFAVKKDAV